MLIRLGLVGEYSELLRLLGSERPYCLLKALLQRRSVVIAVESGSSRIRCAALVTMSGVVAIGGDGSRKEGLYLERLRWHAREVQEQIEEGLIGSDC